MPDYSKIQNERLRELVMASESIHSRPEAEVQAIIDGLATLPSEKQREAIKMLLEEQEKIQKAKLARGITPEKEIAEIEKNSQKLGAIKREYDTSVRQYQEGQSREDEDQAADNLLNNL